MESEQNKVQKVGLNRYLVRCVKCGYEWLAYNPQPKRCALCGCLSPDKPSRYKTQGHNRQVTTK